MASINYLQVLEGEQIKETCVRVKDDQIVPDAPDGIEISIWRDDEVTAKKFQLRIKMPWGNVYTLDSYETKKEAAERFKDTVSRLKSGKAKIKPGKSLSIVSGK
jgi:hypothetical protein